MATCLHPRHIVAASSCLHRTIARDFEPCGIAHFRLLCRNVPFVGDSLALRNLHNENFAEGMSKRRLPDSYKDALALLLDAGEQVWASLQAVSRFSVRRASITDTDCDHIKAPQVLG